MGPSLRGGETNTIKLNVPTGNTDFVAVTAGNYHSLGLKTDGLIVGGDATTPGRLVFLHQTHILSLSRRAGSTI